MVPVNGVNMAAASTGVSVKWPPQFISEDTYEVWKNDLNIWCELCEVPKAKRALAVHLSLPTDSRARAATSEIPIEDLKKDNGVDILIGKLDNLFLPDKGRRQFAAFKTLYNLRRPEHVTISDFVTDFEHTYFKFKKQDMTLPDSVMAFMLLASSVLSDNESQLVMSAIVDVTYDSMKSALKRTFGSEIKKSPIISTVDIRSEPTFCTGNSGSGASAGDVYGGSTGTGSAADEVYYARPQPRGRGRGGRFTGRGRGRGGRTPLTGSNNVPLGGEYNITRKVNPIDSEGNVSRCVICESKLHWAKNCPHSYEKMRKEENSDNSNENVQLSLFMGLTDGCEESSKLNNLMNDSIGCAVLDTGCINTVCGSVWLERYLDMLPDSERAKILEESSQKSFTFGDGATVSSLKRVTLPCLIGGYRSTLVTDVVKCNIPLLMSKTAMKRAKMCIDFESDSAIISGNNVSLQCASSGHYILPLMR